MHVEFRKLWAGAIHRLSCLRPFADTFIYRKCRSTNFQETQLVLSHPVKVQRNPCNSDPPVCIDGHYRWTLRQSRTVFQSQLKLKKELHPVSWNLFSFLSEHHCEVHFHKTDPPPPLRHFPPASSFCLVTPFCFPILAQIYFLPASGEKT